ncbi:MAG: hypothetical protein Q4G69_07195 [Planctomycetia bacterium]|nr:hypothetical protein [Planctomycetia bacterium]
MASGKWTVCDELFEPEPIPDQSGEVYFSDNPYESRETVPEKSNQKKQNRIRYFFALEWARARGFLFLGCMEHSLKHKSAAWIIPEQSLLFLCYLDAKDYMFFSLTTYFDDEKILNTLSTPIPGVSRPGIYSQCRVPGFPPLESAPAGDEEELEQLAKMHEESIQYLINQGKVRLVPFQTRPFELYENGPQDDLAHKETILSAMKKPDPVFLLNALTEVKESWVRSTYDYFRSLPFWRFRIHYWFYKKPYRTVNKTLEQIYKGKLP